MRSRKLPFLACALVVAFFTLACFSGNVPAGMSRKEKDSREAVSSDLESLTRDAPTLSADEFAKRRSLVERGIAAWRVDADTSISWMEDHGGSRPVMEAEEARNAEQLNDFREQLDSITPKGSVATPEGPDDSSSGTALYEERPEGDSVEIFKIGSMLAVQNGGSSPTVAFRKAYYLTEITTYHWNNSKDKAPGTIALRGDDGKTYGPWKAHLVNGVYWVASPNATVPAGSYTVIDSDPSTWAQNSESGGMGMCWASGVSE